MKFGCEPPINSIIKLNNSTFKYSNYVLDQISMRINGRSTKGENIADNGGLKQAYRAYKKYERFHSVPQSLPGVNLTQDQLFFLNYAQASNQMIR